jgi:SAM-dependent methyltransferase
MASLLRHGLALLRAPGNSLGFTVRQAVGSRRAARRGGEARAFGLPSDGQDGWLRSLGPAARRRAGRLRQRYDLAALQACSTDCVFAENLAVLEALETVFAGDRPPVTGTCAAVDVGSGVFAYATALQRFCTRFAAAGAAPPVDLLGVEVDGYRRLRGGGDRRDHGEAHAALAGAGVHYRVADFRHLELAPQHVVTMFFPFVTAYALLQWGAPLQHWRPRALLRKAAAVLEPGGLLFVANQTGGEFERMRALLSGLPLELVRARPIASDLVPYAARTEGRVGSLWRRRGPGDGPPAGG